MYSNRKDLKWLNGDAGNSQSDSLDITGNNLIGDSEHKTKLDHIEVD
jgi:hypothetical protein